MLNNKVSYYNKALLTCLDTHAPSKSRRISVRPKAHWLNDDIHAAKHTRRQLERKWRKTRLLEDRLLFQKQKAVVSSMYRQAKTDYLTGMVKENCQDPKLLFKTIEKLLYIKRSSPLPDHESPAELAAAFAAFFDKKVEKVCNDLGTEVNLANLHEEPKYHTTLEYLAPATEEEIVKTIKKSATKHCSLDPIPTWLLKQCLQELAPVLTDIINQSFREGHVPDDFKQAVVIPVLKKIILAVIFKNFRPVSNLPYVAKVMEKVACARLLDHCMHNNINEPLQSAYTSGCSTETALLRVHNDILMAMDKQKVVCLILLDLSAAFDTVNHDIMLNRLEHRVGVKGTALQWFKSYLQDRGQYVLVDGHTSETLPLRCGVPQGSVLGPVLFTIYTTTLGDVIRGHGVDFHLYADDTQIYMTLDPAHTLSQEAAVHKLQECVQSIGAWMIENKLKLNDDKTEVMLFGTPKQLDKVSLMEVRIGTSNITVKDQVRNLGVVMDRTMSMGLQVSAVCKSAHYQLRNLAQIRKYIDKPTAERVVHAFVTSRLDCCNSLLFGIHKKQIAKLQKVQNAAAKLVTSKKKYDHATPLLKDLHWLPVSERIIYKILVLTFKCMRGLSPVYMSTLLEEHKPARTTRSVSTHLLAQPKTKLKTAGDRCFSSAAPKLWNGLPLGLRNSASVEVFKRHLKTHLFAKYFD